MSDFIDKAKEFIEQKHRLILLIILAFAFIIRLKYMTINAALWWDEADYLTLAKHYGLGLYEQAAPWRARAIPMVFGIFYWLGANEWFIRFIEVIVSVTGVYFTYKIGELYSRPIGYIAALGMAVYFEFLFWTARISMDIYAVAICTAAMWLFWKGYVEKKGWKYTAGAGALLGFGSFGYESTAFMFIIIALFLLISDRFRFLKRKEFWAFVIAAILLATPFLIYNQSTFGSIYPRAMHQARAIETVGENAAASWNPTTSTLISKLVTYPKYMPYMLKWPFFIAFLFGLTMFANMFLGFDLIIKGKNDELRKDLFIFIWAFVVLLIFSIVYAVTADFEPGVRFVFPMMPIVFLIMGYGITKAYKFIRKQSAIAAILVVALVLVAGVYYQLSFADQLIKAKSDSYRAENEAGTWIKEHTEKDAVALGCGLAVPLLYYTQRDFKSTGDNATYVEEMLAKYKPRYYLIDGFDPGCRNIMSYPDSHPERFRLVQVFFVDAGKTQPIMAIYEVNYAASTIN